jgi:PhnB protein
MAALNVYLNFPGNCEEAFNYYKSVFGGEFPYIGRYKDMPPQEGMPPVSAEDGEKILHVSLPMSGGAVLMGADAIEGFGPPLVAGNNVSLSLNVDSREEADRLFGALSSGGAVIMPMGDTFWDAYFGMCVDSFGINWMVSFETPQAG